MGFFSKLREVNEITHGKRLERQFQETLNYMATFDSHTYERTLNDFLRHLFSVQEKIPALDTDSSLQLAKELSSEARELAKIDGSMACSSWLAAAWLESLVRDSNEAERAFSSLENLALKVRRENFKKRKPPSLWECPQNGRRGMPQVDLGKPHGRVDIQDAELYYFWDVPYVTGKKSYKKYSYLVWVRLRGEEFYVGLGCKNKTNHFLEGYYNNGKSILYQENIEPSMQSDADFRVMTQGIVSKMLKASDD